MHESEIDVTLGFSGSFVTWAPTRPHAHAHAHVPHGRTHTCPPTLTCAGTRARTHARVTEARAHAPTHMRT